MITKIVKYGAAWCGPCKALKPIWKQLADVIGSDITLEEYDVDESVDMVAKHNIRSVPTIIYFSGDKEVHRSSGLVSVANIQKVITDNQ